MPSAAAVRLQVESALARRVPSALTPIQRQVRPLRPTGIANVDDLFGGFPEGAITELTGPESSGRTSLALAFVSRTTRQDTVCAWIDASDSFCGESAAAAGVDLARLLWVRCGVQAGAGQPGYPYTFAVPEHYMQPRTAIKGLHGGGFGPHPRTETKRLSEAIGDLFPDGEKPEAVVVPSPVSASSEAVNAPPIARRTSGKPWGRVEQSLRATDLVLQAGGFGAIVLDLGSIAPEYVSRVELSVWFRYRAAVERSQASLVLITKHPCAKSAGELLLRLQAGDARSDEATVFTGVSHRLEVERRRFADNVLPLKKPPQSAASWQTRPDWIVR